MAQNVLSAIGLTTSNSEIETIYTNRANLGDVAYGSVDYADAVNYLTATTSSLTAGGTNTNLYRYASIAFPVTVGGTYTFGQSSAPFDSFLLVYSGAIDPTNLAQNFLTGNDDSGVGRGWNSGATIPPGVTMGICGSLIVQCPVVTTNLSSNQTYTLFLSHYGAFDASNFAFPLGIFVYGPGGVSFIPTGVRVLDSTVATNNSPAMGAARVIDGSDALLAVFAGAGLVGDQAISQGVTQTLPLLTGGATVAVQSALGGINQIVQARIENNRGMSSGDVFYGDKNFWMKPFGSWADQDNSDGVAGYKAETLGTVFGVDGAISPLVRLGGAFAYARSDIDGRSDIAPQNADVDIYQLIGYGSYSLDERTELNFQVDVGQNANKGRRQIAFTSSVASSNYTSYTAHIGAGVGRRYQLNDKTDFFSSLRADYTMIRDRAYRETGADLLNLDVHRRTTEAFVVAIDEKLSYRYSERTTLLANLGVGYDTINERAAITATFAGAPGAAFVTYGIDPDPWLLRAGLGAVYKTKSGLEITGRYDAESRQGFLNQTLSAKLRWSF